LALALLPEIRMASLPVNVPRIVPTMRRDVVFPQRGKAASHLLSAESIDSSDVDAYCRAAEAFEAGAPARQALSARRWP
jgi:hypothetical protein